MRWDLRSRRLTAGVSAVFAETFPSRSGREGGHHALSFNWVTWSDHPPWSEANDCLSPSANHCEAEEFSLPRDGRTSVSPSRLSFSLSLSSLKKRRPLFSPSASQRSCSSYCKSKNPNLSAHSFLLYCGGKDLTLSSLPGLCWPPLDCPWLFFFFKLFSPRSLQELFDFPIIVPLCLITLSFWVINFNTNFLIYFEF